MSVVLAVVLFCAGAYHPAAGTNFGSCQLVDRSAQIESPGDAGSACE